MKNQRRDDYFDNAKFLLILLVVFGHLLQPFTKYSRWVYDLYLLIYSFHMPTFIFISGYFADSFIRKDKPIRDSFYKLIVPYIIFQWGYSFYYWLIGINDSFSFGLLVPNWSLWFLVSSFFWRISLYFFSEVKPMTGICISILGSLLIGYVPFIGRELTLQRTFVFLPFFIIGYHIKEDRIHLFRKSKWKRWFSAALPIIFLIIHCIPDINGYIFFGSKPYEDFLDIAEFGAVIRLFSLTLGIVGIVGFLSIVPVEKQFFTRWGQNTLVVYLFHGFFVRGLRALQFSEYISSSYSHIIVLFALLIGSFILTIFLASEPIVKFYEEIINWCIKRPWKSIKMGQ
ncbi:MAG TPA: acyltransferase family protein [Tepidimicrobium sp.]|nr:acyltransferase family protein [Tepidimicrobium sp.]